MTSHSTRPPSLFRHTWLKVIAIITLIVWAISLILVIPVDLWLIASSNLTWQYQVLNLIRPVLTISTALVIALFLLWLSTYVAQAMSRWLKPKISLTIYGIFASAFVILCFFYAWLIISFSQYANITTQQLGDTLYVVRGSGFMDTYTKNYRPLANPFLMEAEGFDVFLSDGDTEIRGDYPEQFEEEITARY